MSDPLADMLISMVNASRVGKTHVFIPYSKVKLEIARLLQEKGYCKDVSRRGKKNRRTLDIALSYDNNEKPMLHAARLLSRQSVRRYGGWRDLKKMRATRGIIIVSTPKGIMTHKKAQKEKIGGELIAYVY